MPVTLNIQWKWILLVVLLATAVYWWANIAVWVAWSLSVTGGKIAMLTIAPGLWVWAAYQCLKSESGLPLFLQAWFTAMLFLIINVSTDLVFFGILRGDMQQLLTLATYAGYFLICILPFIWSYYFSRRPSNESSVTESSIVYAALAAAVGIGLLLTFHFLGPLVSIMHFT
jgi:hypothetical protein